MRFRTTLRRILTAPFRLITWPFRALRDFLNYEAEDSSASEVLARTLNNPSALLDHLVALRGTLIRSVISLVITTTTWAFARRQRDRGKGDREEGVAGKTLTVFVIPGRSELCNG